MYLAVEFDEKVKQKFLDEKELIVSLASMYWLQEI